MSTEFKTGDLLKFKQQFKDNWKVNNRWYLSFNIDLDDICELVKYDQYYCKVKFKDYPKTLTFALAYFELAGPPKTQEERVIEKIKYLNNRFSERKHAQAA
jgi:hypothetical protein